MAMHRRLRGLLEDNIYCQARFFSVWELKEMIKKIMGPISIQWGTALFFPPALGKMTRSVEHHPFFQQNPLGAFIVMKVDISYRFITCKDHLKTPLHKKHGQLPQGSLKVFSPPPVWKEKRRPEAFSAHDRKMAWSIGHRAYGHECVIVRNLKHPLPNPECCLLQAARCPAVFPHALCLL